MAVASLRTHTDAILTKLVATTIAVGDGIKPANAGWLGMPGEDLFEPYMVLYPLTPEFDGSLADDDDADIEYQVTCVGETREQAEWVADAAIAALVRQTVTIAGRAMRAPIRLVAGSAGARRDDDVLPSVFYATPRFSLYTTPA